MNNLSPPDTQVVPPQSGGRSSQSPLSSQWLSVSVAVIIIGRSNIRGD